ncbi:MAG: type II secretion system protein [Pseudomonadota bacterium]
MFIAIVAISVTGILSVFTYTTRHSSDPLAQKQALAIAESLLEEVLLMPFTYCDPDDPNASTATGPGDCTIPEALGPEPGESRYSATSPFDNVNDYHGFDTQTASPAGICDLAGNCFSALSAYRAVVSVAQEAAGGIPAGDSLRVTVTVTGPAGTSVTVDGYRTRHTPTGVP